MLVIPWRFGFCAEIGAVSSEFEHHTMEMVIIVVSFAFQLARQ